MKFNVKNLNLLKTSWKIVCFNKMNYLKDIKVKLKHMKKLRLALMFKKETLKIQ